MHQMSNNATPVPNNLTKQPNALKKLKNALKILLDETRPLAERIKQIRDTKSDDYIKFIGRAIYTPILFLAYPKKYPVINDVGIFALDHLGLYSYKEHEKKQEFAGDNGQNTCRNNKNHEKTTKLLKKGNLDPA